MPLIGYKPTGPLRTRIASAAAAHEQSAQALHEVLMLNLARVVRAFFPAAEVVTMSEEGRWQQPYGLMITSVRDGNGTVLWDHGSTDVPVGRTIDDYSWYDVATYLGPQVSGGLCTGSPGAHWDLLDADAQDTQYRVELPDRHAVAACTTPSRSIRARIRALLPSIGHRSS